MIYLLCIVFRVVLDLSYVLFVSQVFEYQGYTLNYKPEAYALSWGVYVLSFYFISKTLIRVSDYFFILAVLAFMAPLSSYYGLSDKPFFPILMCTISLWVVYFFSRTRLLKTPYIPLLKDGRYMALVLAGSGVLYLILWYFLSGAAFNLNFSLAKVYDYRVENAKLSDVGFLAYLNSWTYQVFTIFLLSYFLHKRKLVPAVFIVFIQVFFFSVSAHKSILFYPFMIIGIWFYFKRFNGLSIVPILFSGVVGGALLCYLVWDEVFFGSLFIRRVFYVPSWLTYGYFDFFYDNPHLYWSNSILSSYFSYPYSERITILIGQHLGSEGSGNNGFISSGYAHAGILGIIIYSVIFGVVLRFIDSTSLNRVPVWLSLCLTVVPLRSALLSSDLLTTLLTHGLLAAVILLMLIRERPEPSDSSKTNG